MCHRQVPESGQAPTYLGLQRASLSDGNLPLDRATGDALAQGGNSWAVRVSAQVIQHDRTVLINPRHPQIFLVSVAFTDHFAFDTRLE
jgi:hypothetical protein